MKKMKRKNIVGLIAIVAIVAIAMFSGCVEEETPTKVPETTTPPEAPTPTPIATPTESILTPAPTPTAPTELSLKIGETAKTSKVEVTVKSVEKADSYDWHSGDYTEFVPEGKIYLIVEAEIKNIGSDRVYVGSDEFSAMDSEGFRYDPEWAFLDDDLAMIQELYQNQRMKGKVLFEIPENAKGLKVQYNFGNLFTRVKLASWELE